MWYLVKSFGEVQEDAIHGLALVCSHGHLLQEFQQVGGTGVPLGETMLTVPDEHSWASLNENLAAEER